MKYWILFLLKISKKNYIWRLFIGLFLSFAMSTKLSMKKYLHDHDKGYSRHSLRESSPVFWWIFARIWKRSKTLDQMLECNIDLSLKMISSWEWSRWWQNAILKNLKISVWNFYSILHFSGNKNRFLRISKIHNKDSVIVPPWFMVHHD